MTTPSTSATDHDTPAADPAGAAAVGAGTTPPAEPTATSAPASPPAAPQPPLWARQEPEPHPSGLSGELRGRGVGAHLSGLAAAVLSAAALGFLGPLIVYLLWRGEHPFSDHHAKEALNFQLTVLLAITAGVVLAIPAVIFGVLTLGLGFLAIGVLVLAAFIAWIVFPIVGAVRASNGEGYRYPLTIRFLR